MFFMISGEQETRTRNILLGLQILLQVFIERLDFFLILVILII